MSKAQHTNNFCDPCKPCHVGIHWKALTVYHQMSTNVPGFQSFYTLFFIILNMYFVI